MGMGWDTSGRRLAAVSWRPDRRRVKNPALSLGLALLQGSCLLAGLGGTIGEYRYPLLILSADAGGAKPHPFRSHFYFFDCFQ